MAVLNAGGTSAISSSSALIWVGLSSCSIFASFGSDADVATSELGFFVLLVLAMFNGMFIVKSGQV
jgi:hypothetical protein